MARVDPEVLAHLEWLGFVQPTGLVVSAPALARAGAILDRRDAAGQELLRAALDPATAEDDPVVTDFEQFAGDVLGWTFVAKGYAGTEAAPVPDELHVALPDYGETLFPDYAVRELNPADGAPAWQLLVTTLTPGSDLDAVRVGGGLLETSPHGRMERLLRETGVSAGLLFNGRALRLISAPRGESSGWLQFDVAAMAQTAGRPICTAMRLLLGQQRLLVLPKEKRLAALLDDSRKFQNEVSEKLAGQVLHALYELLRGFQAAHDASGGELLRDPLGDDPDDVYRGLLTVILRLVFLLYAEERDMLPTEDETFGRYYSLAGLFTRLRDHAAHFPDTMDQRFGAWAQLLVLFRMVHDGATAGAVKLPPRHGGLFDPDRYPFLEGRAGAGSRQRHERIEAPRVPDGTVFRALEKLLVLDGERLSYRALDVEQIGSVYQTMMGFRLEATTGRSLAVKAKQRMGAPTAIDLDALLSVEGGKRGKWVKDIADRDLPARVGNGVRAAASIEELHSALAPVVDAAASPDLLPAGAMVLQPSGERRKSGSHYTPRALTEPIVRTTLAPVLAALRGEDGKPPTPEQILELKVCDPAMGSAAFLVEACRQLADALTESWAIHGGRPVMPADEDELILAMRLVAQRCLYGLDRNPVAVDLAKMSLWLATLARDHPLTFLDHALRYGDALVGLSRRQIQAFHWDDTKPPLAPVRITKHLERVTELRKQIREAGDDASDFALRDMWDEAQAELKEVRLFGDLAVLAFFSGAKARERETKRDEFASAVADGDAGRYRGLVDEAREGTPSLAPFHWDIEFPEVFQRESPGFDAVVGNPPFAGSVSLATNAPGGYTDWLRWRFRGAGGKADLVAFFFRRAFDLLRPGLGSFGLVATNTIRQGDSRESSLLPITRDGGWIYRAVRRLRWPGSAAVMVAVIHVQRSPERRESPLLDGTPVARISAYLLGIGPDESPRPLVQPFAALMGAKPGSRGFVIDSVGKAGFSDAEIDALIALEPGDANLVAPYVTGEDLMSNPTPGPRRRIVDCGDMSLGELEGRYPHLVARLRSKVGHPAGSTTWHRFQRPAKALRTWLLHDDGEAFLCTAETSTWHAVTLVRRPCLPSNTVIVFTTSLWAAFGVLQSRVHEAWARSFSSTMKDDLRYTPSDAFETFPFPAAWDASPRLEHSGAEYHESRAGFLVANEEGLTDLYNRFHDPDQDSGDIATLRGLHAAMDRAVLDAYGWADIPTDCEFLLDYEVDDEDGSSRRKKPWRYRWPDDVHDEVLARLLALNAEHADQERRSGAAAEAGTARKRSAAKKAGRQTEGLFS
jgi:hypothetical protein